MAAGAEGVGFDLGFAAKPMNFVKSETILGTDEKSATTAKITLAPKVKPKKVPQPDQEEVKET